MKKEFSKCPACGRIHEVQTIRQSDDTLEGLSIDQVYCNYTGVLLTQDEAEEILSKKQDPVVMEPEMFGCNDIPDAADNELGSEDDVVNQWARDFMEPEEEEDTPVESMCCIVSISHIQNSNCLKTQKMLFSSIDKATAWLQRNEFFWGHNPFYSVFPEEEGYGEWLHPSNKENDYLSVRISSTGIDTGSTFE